MNFVTACANCSKSFVPSNGREWCSGCTVKFVKTFKDPDKWYILDDPISPDCDHDSVQGNLDCPPIEPHIPYVPPVIVADDPQGPQPDPAKVDLAVQRMKEVKVFKARGSTQTDPTPTPTDPDNETQKRVDSDWCLDPHCVCKAPELDGPMTGTRLALEREAGITKHAAEVQRKLNLEMRRLLESPEMDEYLRKIFRKDLQTKDLDYPVLSAREKYEKF